MIMETLNLPIGIGFFAAVIGSFIIIVGVTAIERLIKIIVEWRVKKA